MGLLSWREVGGMRSGKGRVYVRHIHTLLMLKDFRVYVIGGKK